MAVNHFLFDDEELIDEFENLIEQEIEVIDKYDDYSIRYNAKRQKEYWDIRKELLERMKK